MVSRRGPQQSFAGGAFARLKDGLLRVKKVAKDKYEKKPTKGKKKIMTESKRSQDEEDGVERNPEMAG